MKLQNLITLSNKVIPLLHKEGIQPILYGSYLVKHYTKSNVLKVNDLDFYVYKKDLKKIAQIAKKNNLEVDDSSIGEWKTLSIHQAKAKIEFDAIDHWFKGKPTTTSIKLGKHKVNALTKESLTQIYKHATEHSDAKESNKLKYDLLIINTPTIETTRNKNLTLAQKRIINNARIQEWGKFATKNFTTDFEPNTIWFVVKHNKKTVALGGLRPIKIKHNKTTYNILGICSIISLVKKKGYGKILMASMVDHSIKTGKTLLGFTDQTKFFQKIKLDTKKGFIKRFIYITKKGEEIHDNDGDGIYYQGKEKCITKILKSKSPVYIAVEHW
ncbi:MAG: hypothetical protein ACI9P9_000400 [Patescibacteria group bacterium]|jgi:hypothetical protein